MRGHVLGVDRDSGEGQISGEDGQRYTFRPGDWSDSKGPAAGVHIDFTTDGTRALRIFRLPASGQPAPRPPVENDRNKFVAVLLALFLGVLGIHRFYLGRNGSGVVMLVMTLTLVGVFVTSIWALVDAVRYLLMSDAEFAHRYARVYRS